jgi:uncharacterized protein (TIGR02391 family)
MSNERIAAFMQGFPPEREVLQMAPEELGPHILRHLLKGADANRFNFMLGVPSGQITNCFMEAWGWLEREGFIAHQANDMHGMSFFITRKGHTIAGAEDFDAWRRANLFPEDLDAALMRYVRPLFLRGDYDTAVFRAFKEVEVRVRKKAGLNNEYGRTLMLKAFGETGSLMRDDKESRNAARELFAGAISFFKNPSSHHEIRFENPREVIDMICFANQLLTIVGRLSPA